MYTLTSEISSRRPQMPLIRAKEHKYLPCSGQPNCLHSINMISRAPMYYTQITHPFSNGSNEYANRPRVANKCPYITGDRFAPLPAQNKHEKNHYIFTLSNPLIVLCQKVNSITR